MNTSDPAEQIVRITIDEMVVFLKVAGELSKNAIAMLNTICKDREQTMGKTTLKNMLKTGSGLKLYSIDAKDLKTFSKEAKNYGILYCALTSKQEEKIDGTVDLMVREEDAARVNRIAKRFNFSTVDITAIEHDLEREKQAKEKELYNDESVEKSPVEIMVDDLLATEETTKEEQETPINEQELEQELIRQIQNPSNTQKLSAENESQLEPLSSTKKNEEKTEETRKIDNGKKSVREELTAIAVELEEKKAKEKEQENILDELVTNEQKEKNNNQSFRHKAQHKQRRKQKGKRYKMPKHLAEK